MIDIPFNFEPDLQDSEFEKLGRLTLRWAHIDHVIGNCLKRLLRLSDEDAIKVIFPMPEERRMTTINELAPERRLKKDAIIALEALNWVLPGIRMVRNNVIHTVMFQDKDGNHYFELRSKRRKLSKEQVFAVEELTNFAAHAVLSFRFALGLKSRVVARHALPGRPAVPECLRAYFQANNPGRKAQRAARRGSSRGSRQV